MYFISYQGNIYILVLVILLCACHLSFFYTFLFQL